MTSKTKKQKIFSSLLIALTSVMAFSFAVSITPFQPTVKDDIQNKEKESSELYINGEDLAEFAAKFEHVETITGKEAIAHNAKVDDIILNDDLSDEKKWQYLNALGVYEVYPEKKVELADSCGSDMSLNKPTIAYDSSNKQYIITGTGYWKNRTYEDEMPRFIFSWPSVGKKINIGGPDAIGISLTNTSGDTKGLAINSGYGYFYNGEAVNLSTTLCTNTNNYGGAYQLQDFAKIFEVKNYLFFARCGYYYNANNMTCILRYNSAFENYSGNANLFYSHTWDKTSVTGIDLSDSGFGIQWSKDSDCCWDAHSYSTVFPYGEYPVYTGLPNLYPSRTSGCSGRRS